MKTALLVFLLGTISAYGQNSAAMAAQQATDQAIQASQQAQATAQQAMDQATITSQQSTITQLQISAITSSSSSCPGPIIGASNQPTFSVKPGKVAAGTVVILKSATHYAIIFYSTDGWAPSTASIRYTGPITINAVTHFQAIALAPNTIHSSIARADYTVDTPALPTTPQPPLVTDGVLRKGTALRLVTNSHVSSQTAQVGDKLPLLLDQDIQLNGSVVIPKGTPVDAILTIADPAAKYYEPGDLVFELHTLNAKGYTILLSGGETLEGVAARKPKDAVIEPGMAVTAIVASETQLNR